VAAGFMVGTFWLLAGFAVAEWRREGRAAASVSGSQPPPPHPGVR